jgi:hypothetical protein
MKRRAGWQTWREKQVLPRPSLREMLSASAYLLALGVALVVGVALPLVALLFLMSFVPPRGLEQPILVVIGLGFVLFAVWGFVRIATGKSAPGTTRRQKVFAGTMLVLLGLGGAGFLAAGIASRSGVGF